MVIGLTGPKLSGKSCAAAFFVEEFKAQRYVFSDILVKIAQILQLEISRQNLITLGAGLRRVFDNGILARVFVGDLQDKLTAFAVIDGLRYQEELKELKKIPDFKLIYIEAPLVTRFQRSKKRKEKVGEDKMNFKQFEDEELAQTEREITSLRDVADVVIINNGTLDSFHLKLRQVVT